MGGRYLCAFRSSSNCYLACFNTCYHTSRFTNSCSLSITTRPLNRRSRIQIVWRTSGCEIKCFSYFDRISATNCNRLQRIPCAWRICCQRPRRERQDHRHRQNQREQPAFYRFHKILPFLTCAAEGPLPDGRGLAPPPRSACGPILPRQCERPVSKLYLSCIVS